MPSATRGAFLKNAKRAPLDPPKNFCLIIKSFCGVQGRFFQKEPLAAGGK
jgi:hypothetical protein